MNIKVQLEKLLSEALLALATADEQGLRELEIRLLGRKGEMNRILSALPSLKPEERSAAGSAANSVKLKIESAILERRTKLSRELESGLASTEWIDVTEPGVASAAGHAHPINSAIDEIVTLFERIGFRRARYAEADWEHYAFEALNMPKDHPARDEWETFFLDSPAHPKNGKVVLTPHTSNAQVHEMERRKPPIRMVSIGKCYRRESNVSHIPMFHQFEGLVIDKGIALTHLRGVLDYFAKNFFGPDRSFRLRPFHFQFTEPSFELDISCGICKGTGILKFDFGGKKSNFETPCRLCKSGWLELGGAGMVHPNVLRAGGIDPKVYSGFAFGWGVERTWMMRSGMKIDDIRVIYENDLQFLKQF
jgi:phenylalanyl-tRNA synthetase alpha chain